MEQIIKFSKEDIKAIEAVASISCCGLSCSNCPINIANIPYSLTTGGCYKILANALLRVNEQKEDINEDKNS